MYLDLKKNNAHINLLSKFLTNCQKLFLKDYCNEVTAVTEKVTTTRKQSEMP